MSVKGDGGSDHVQPKRLEQNQANLEKIRHENPIESKVERPKAGSVEALFSAQTAYSKAHPDAQKLFRECYADNTDPSIKDMLALMTGEKKITELLG